MTPLALKLISKIEADGPMGMDAYMAVCLYDPESGYYAQGRNFLPGPDGVGTYPHDFVTAPELGAVFGRTLARWVAKAWEIVGKPNPCVLMEAGPGRGVLMRDMLGALQADFQEVYTAVRPVLVEVSPALRELQAVTLADFPQCVWREDAAVDGAVILVANELLDAFPFKQMTAEGERTVAVEDGKLVVTGGEVVDEVSPAMEQWLRDLPEGLVAACLLDYGAEAEASGDTLQGVYRHTKVGVLERPGEVDLTCHVNFKRVRAVMEMHKNLEVEPLEPLMSFLVRNGIASVALAEGPQGVPDTVLNRLLHPVEMGTLFKVQVYMKCSSRTRP